MNRAKIRLRDLRVEHYEPRVTFPEQMLKDSVWMISLGSKGIAVCVRFMEKPQK